MSLEKFKRRLIRTIARLVYTEGRSMNEVWKLLKQEIKFDCEEIWNRMRLITTKKLNRMLVTGDFIGNIPSVALMSVTDWLLYDLVLVHEQFDVIGLSYIKNKKAEPKQMSELFALVQEYDLELLSGTELVEGWIKATTEYNSKGRQCSPMLLQKRWYQLKEATRNGFYDLWSVFRGVDKKFHAARHCSPTDLQTKIAIWCPKIICNDFDKWESLIKKDLVALPEMFELFLRNQKVALLDNDHQPDFCIIENALETINIDSDSSSDGESDKPEISKKNTESLNNNSAFNILIKEEPIREIKKESISTVCNIDVNVDDNVSNLQEDTIFKLSDKANEAYKYNCKQQQNSEIISHSIELDANKSNQSTEHRNVNCDEVLNQLTAQLILEAVKKKQLSNEDALSLTEINFADNGIEFVDDGIEFFEDDSNECAESGVQSNSKGSQQVQINTTIGVNGNDSHEGLDSKLFMDSVVYTTRIDDMKILENHLCSVKDIKTINKILLKSKPIPKISTNCIKTGDEDHSLAIKDTKENVSLNSQNDINSIGKHCGDLDNNKDVENLKLKLTSSLLQKPKYCTYNPIQLCKNPDFNTRLKRLNFGFFSFTRNVQMLKTCKPVTIDVHKSFEKRLIDGVLYLKPCENGINVDNKEVLVKNNICTDSIIPKALPVQSLLNVEKSTKSSLNKGVRSQISYDSNNIQQNIDVGSNEMNRCNKDSLTENESTASDTLSSSESTFSMLSKKLKLLNQFIKEKPITKKKEQKHSYDYTAKPWFITENKINEPFLLTYNALSKMVKLLNCSTMNKNDVKKMHKKWQELDGRPIKKTEQNKDNTTINEVKNNVIEVNHSNDKQEKEKAIEESDNKRLPRPKINITQGPVLKGKFCCWSRKKIGILVFNCKYRLEEHPCVKYCVCCCKDQLAQTMEKNDSLNGKMIGYQVGVFKPKSKDNSDLSPQIVISQLDATKNMKPSIQIVLSAADAKENPIFTNTDTVETSDKIKSTQNESAINNLVQSENTNLSVTHKKTCCWCRLQIISLDVGFNAPDHPCDTLSQCVCCCRYFLKRKMKNIYVNVKHIKNTIFKDNISNCEISDEIETAIPDEVRPPTPDVDLENPGNLGVQVSEERIKEIPKITVPCKSTDEISISGINKSLQLSTLPSIEPVKEFFNKVHNGLESITNKLKRKSIGDNVLPSANKFTVPKIRDKKLQQLPTTCIMSSKNRPLQLGEDVFLLSTVPMPNCTSSGYGHSSITAPSKLVVNSHSKNKNKDTLNKQANKVSLQSSDKKVVNEIIDLSLSDDDCENVIKSSLKNTLTSEESKRVQEIDATEKIKSLSKNDGAIRSNSVLCTQNSDLSNESTGLNINDDTEVSENNKLRRKSLLTDLMVMSGISTEDAIPVENILVPPIKLADSVASSTSTILNTPMTPEEADPSISVSAVQSTELYPVLSLSHLKHSAGVNAIFFKLNLKTGNIVNVSIEIQPRKRVLRKMARSEPIDLTTIQVIGKDMHCTLPNILRLKKIKLSQNKFDKTSANLKVKDNLNKTESNDSVLKPLKLIRPIHKTNNINNFPSLQKSLLRVKNRHPSLKAHAKKTKINIIDSVLSEKEIYLNSNVKLKEKCKLSSANIGQDDKNGFASSDDEPLVKKKKQKDKMMLEVIKFQESESTTMVSDDQVIATKRVTNVTQEPVRAQPTILDLPENVRVESIETVKRGPDETATLAFINIENDEGPEDCILGV